MIIFITGGARSGKSRYAQQQALLMTTQPVYLATARNWDDNFNERIERHKADRDARWTNLEEEKNISRPDIAGRVVVIDCITLWLTNFFADLKGDIEACLQQARLELAQLEQHPGTYLIISNELGMGLHADTESGRRFTDLQGWVNQEIAALAHTVIFMVSGIALTIKTPGV